MSTDSITKHITLKAPLAKVWQSISNADEFGQWFGMRFDGPFKAGEMISGAITPTTVDAEVARSQKPYEGMRFSFRIGEIVPMSRFSFHWHPFAIDQNTDYSAETMTVVTFTMAEVEGGVSLTITETGFDQIPAARRAQAFAANEGGWTAQMRLIEAYLAG